MRLACRGSVRFRTPSGLTSSGSSRLWIALWRRWSRPWRRGRGPSAADDQTVRDSVNDLGHGLLALFLRPRTQRTARTPLTKQSQRVECVRKLLVDTVQCFVDATLGIPRIKRGTSFADTSSRWRISFSSPKYVIISSAFTSANR